MHRKIPPLPRPKKAPDDTTAALYFKTTIASYSLGKQAARGHLARIKNPAMLSAYGSPTFCT